LNIWIAVYPYLSEKSDHYSLTGSFGSAIDRKISSKGGMALSFYQVERRQRLVGFPWNELTVAVANDPEII
jgi:hypothetical protein